MAFSLEASIIIPASILILASLGMRSLHIHQNHNENTKREAVQAADRLANRAIYNPVKRSDGSLADLQTNPITLLKFCIYIEDQATFIGEVLSND